MPAANPSAVADAERSDKSYWTAYDHFMVEREARAMRRAYTWSLVAKGWQAMRQRFGTGLPAGSGAPGVVGAPHARLMHR